MSIKYRKILAASKDVFKPIEEKVADTDYDSFIESLRTLNIKGVNIEEEIIKILDKVSAEADVKMEIISRLGVKRGIRK